VTDAGPDDAHLKAALEEEAALFEGSDDNASPRDGERLYARPFFGYASADDPAWQSVKADVGDSSWTPLEAFLEALPESGATASGLTVVSAVLPVTARTAADQAASDCLPSERWLVSRHFHSLAVDGLARRLASRLGSLGHESMAPDQAPGFKTLPHPRYLFTSKWSQRHAAWAAGLGTFGLSEGLITASGIAHRLTSVIVRARLTPTPRTYAGFRDWCLFFSSGKCGECVRRCPAGAISPDGHDKALCREYMSRTVKPWAAGRFPDMEGAYACGLCQSRVPCASRAPVARA
jgi:ferredoxin